jgi:predicted helicase
VSESDVHDLDCSATTNAGRLASKAARDASDQMTVVFSTYQSIQVISDAQRQHGFPEFDPIICDEAHRATGEMLAGEDESNFVKVHDQAFTRGRKRVNTTATPRVFGEAVKSKASEASKALTLMDDITLFGKDRFVRGFASDHCSLISKASLPSVAPGQGDAGQVLLAGRPDHPPGPS